MKNTTRSTKEKNPATNEVLNTEIVPQPTQELQVNDYDIDAFLEKRVEFITKVNKIMVEGKDYHVIQGKKSLAKGGAEKIASIFGWQAEFRKDEDVIGAFKLTDFIPFVCTLTKSGQFVGEGRGGAMLQKNNGDPNKTIKMAQKSAFIDAVLRASGLSDFFTQDLEDMPKDQISKSPTAQTPEAEYYCETHDLPLVHRPAGKTTSGSPYPAFWACNEKINGKWCKGPFTDTEGNRVKNNPETGTMDIVELSENNELKFDEGEVVESSVDMARRILGEKVPRGDYPA